MSKCGTYHHGDLRNALILAVVGLIEEKGSPDFTMAEAAKRAGVSAAAPYRHFKDREALLEAVADLYFIGLGASAQATRDACIPGSRESILALGHTYLNYVSDRPAFYNLIWSEGGQGSHVRREEEQKPGFYTFVGAVEDWCRQRSLKHCDPLEMAVKLWAMAHGLSVLTINGQISQVMPQNDVAAMLSSSANTFLDGVEGAGTRA